MSFSLCICDFNLNKKEKNPQLIVHTVPVTPSIVLSINDSFDATRDTHERRHVYVCLPPSKHMCMCMCIHVAYEICSRGPVFWNSWEKPTNKVDTRNQPLEPVMNCCPLWWSCQNMWRKITHSSKLPCLCSNDTEKDLLLWSCIENMKSKYERYEWVCFMPDNDEHSRGYLLRKSKFSCLSLWVDGNCVMQRKREGGNRFKAYNYS